MCTDPHGIYYLGPKGSFSYEIASRLKGVKIEARTITEVFERVEASANEKAVGIVPIENSIEGPVHETLDNLFIRDGIYVNREIELKVEIVLAVNKALRNVRRIQRLYAQHYAYSEAKDKLKEIGIEIEDVIPVESTSKETFTPLLTTSQGSS